MLYYDCRISIHTVSRHLFTVSMLIQRTLSSPLLHVIQIFSVEHPAEVAFFGFARPAFGSIPPTVEMQSRYYSLVINGVSV
jgi:hypothetical protein